MFSPLGCRLYREQGLACAAVCREGCYCRQDFYRHPESGQCVPKDTCPSTADWDYTNNRPVQKCNELNEIFNECGSGCGDGCRAYRSPGLICPAVCIQGCTCQRDYFRHPETSSCIPKDSCPTTDKWDYENNRPINNVMKCSNSDEEYRENGSGCGDGKGIIVIAYTGDFCVMGFMVGGFWCPNLNLKIIILGN